MSQDPYRYFRVEASELLEQMGKGVLELERDPVPPDLVPKLLRLAHTLKGAARVVKQGEIAELAHAMEDVLATLRNRTTPVSQEPATALLQKLDAIGARVSALAPPPEGAKQVKAVPAGEALSFVRYDASGMEVLLEGVTELGARTVGLRGCCTSVERVRQLTGLLVEELSPSRRAARTGPSTGHGERELALVEDLRSTAVGLERSLTMGLDDLERELRRVREASERLRLVPASAVFAQLERTARDVALVVKKLVRFEGRGGDVRLDAEVLARVQPALVQLVRNAVAHGIEPREERVAAGKAAAGSLVLEVMRRGGQIIFRCRDDGRGLDLEAVRKSAIRGGMPAAQAERLSAEELVQLLLRGGLSTSAAVSEVAGRGVGLDLAREATQGLGGNIVVRTAAHAGTTFDLVVPASLASLEALLVEVSGISAAVPLEAVRRVMHLGAADLVPSPDGTMVGHEGEMIPLASLEQILGRGASMIDQMRVAVVLASGTGLAALGVERVIDVQTVLVRPLPALTPVGSVVSGVTLDGSGKPVPVLDAEQVVAAARCAELRKSSSQTTSGPILVIDDSLTTRMLEQSILETAGYPVDVASSAEEGLEKARKRRYRAFLVDVEMPGMNGFEFVETTRRDPELRDIPAVLVTSRSSPEDRQRGASVGAASYIVKSDFDQRQLLETIKRLTRQ